jgi:hypothetical protein
MEAIMDMRVSRNWGWHGSWPGLVEPPTPAQARAERRALAGVLARRDDRLLDDVGLSRFEAVELLRRRIGFR